MDLDRFFIDGTWHRADGERAAPIIDPSTEETIGAVALASADEVDLAVAAAKAAFPAFAAQPVAARRDLILAIGAAYGNRQEDLAQAMAREMGAPIDFARRSQVGAGSGHIRAMASALESWQPDEAAGPDGVRILREPVGVCALITPWNWPMNQITLKVIAALAAGCTMVLKPSELAPLSATVFAEICAEAGVPRGVVNMVHGDGEGTGAALCANRDIDMVSFTGSARAGRAITEVSAATLKRVTLELGGKGANVIFADAHARAVERGVRRCFGNSGQSCNAPTRMLVEAGRYEAAVAEAAEAADRVAVAEAGRSGGHIGPLANAAQFEKVQRLIETGIREGARLVAGGPGRPDGTNRGYFARPTVFADVEPQMTIAREEIFGPVLSILPFHDEDEAIAMANDTVYGLTNYVQTADGARARRVARALRSGMVEINGTALGAATPFGGMKQSGNGREGGIWGIEDFTEIKAVSGWGAA